MLAQHIITRPVFDALFSDYQFVNNNTVSRSMQRMIDLLQEQAFEKDTEVLERFYRSVKTNVGGIDNLEGKQTIIKTQAWRLPAFALSCCPEAWHPGAAPRPAPTDPAHGSEGPGSAPFGS